MADFDPDKYLAEKNRGFDPDLYLQQKTGQSSVSPKMSGTQAAVIQGESGALLGLRPVIAGAAAAAGDISGQWDNFKNGKGVNLSQTKEAFLQGRKDANTEQGQASKDQPDISLAANVAGSMLTLPALPAKGLAGAVKLGTGLGAAQAAGSANSVKEAAQDIGSGAALGGAGYGVAKIAGKAINSAAESDFGGNISQKVKDVAKKILVGTPSAITGVPDKEIEAYAAQYDKVSDLIKKSGGEPSVAAEMAKENIQNAVKSTKSHLNSQISDALANASDEKNISITPILDKMRAYKDRLNPHLNPESLNEINQIQSRIVNAAGIYGEARTPGKVSVKDLQQIKQFLGDQAANSFQGSALGFQVGHDASLAAKQGYLEAKNLMDQFGPEEIKNANRQLFQLHKIEDRINKNLIVPGKSDAALYAVGSGAENRDSLALQRLGQFTGKDFVGDLNVMSAAKTFGNPSLSPAYGTGKSIYGTTTGAAVGGALGGPKGAFIGAGIGTVLSSPAALKLAIDTGRISAGVLISTSRALGLSPGNVQKLYQVLQEPQAQEILMRAIADDNNNQAAASQNNAMGAMQRRALQSQ